MVNYDLSSMSSVSVKTTEDSGIIRSILTITNADPEDAGNYTCKPSNAIAASIQVFVSEGKYGKMPRTPAPERLWWVMLYVHEFMNSDRKNTTSISCMLKSTLL